MKLCYKCGQTKLLSEFHNHKGHKDGKTSTCAECNVKKTKAWVASLPQGKADAHKDYHRQYDKLHPIAWERKRNTRFLSMYGRSLSEYNALLAAQDFRCGICKKHMSEVPKALQNDHNHTTKALRGLLCSRCNLRLGHLEDKAFVILAAEYLMKYGEILPQSDDNPSKNTHLA